MNADIVIIGSGVSGLSVAASAVDRGMNVCVVEVDRSYSATSRCAGIATVQMEDGLDIMLAKRGIEVLEKWIERYDLRIEKRGLLTIDRVEELEAYANILDAYGVRNRIHASDDVKDWGWMNTEIEGEEAYLHTYDDITLEPVGFFSSLARGLMERGVKVLSGYGKVKVDDGNDVHVKVNSNGNTIDVRSNAIVLASGAWLSRDILNDRSIDTIRRNLHTYIVPLLFVRYDRVDDTIIPFDDEITGTYWITRGSMLVGADYSAARIDDINLYYKYEEDREYARQIMDALRRRVRGRLEYVKMHYGPINITSDNKPIVGALPGYKNVYILDGLRGYGLARAPALAEMLIDSIDGNKQVISELDVSRLK